MYLVVFEHIIVKIITKLKNYYGSNWIRFKKVFVTDVYNVYCFIYVEEVINSKHLNRFKRNTYYKIFFF